MGARQSKRSVDITTTPKKDGVPADGVVGDAAAPGDGKLERIEETDAKPTSNGRAPYAETADKDKEKEKDKGEDGEKEADKDETNTEEVKPETTAEVPAESGEATTPTEGTPASPDNATSPDSKEAKKKDKGKRKWSFRSISFSKKDKSKPAREDAPKNGDVTKEEPLAESGEEIETVAPAVASPTEEKSAESTPALAVDTAAPVEVKEEEKAAPASPTPVEENKEEPTPAPTPVPVEEKQKEVEKIEPVVAENVEVSPVQTIGPVGVIQAQPIPTPSIIERKTSEDIPSLLPSSPPPTPIDPSPLQQAQQTAANASALAEALKVPAEAASLASRIGTEIVELPQSPQELVYVPGPIPEPEVNVETLKTSEPSPSPVDAEIVSVTVKEPEFIPRQIPIVEKEPESIPVSPKVSEVDKSLVALSPVPTKEPEIVSEQITEIAELPREEFKTIPEPEPASVPCLLDEDESRKILEENQRHQEEGDLVILSEEGPVPVSEEILVEAKPAVIIPGEIKAVDLEETNEVMAPEKVSKPVEAILGAEEFELDGPVSNTFVHDEKAELISQQTIQSKSEPTVMKNEIIDDVPPPLPESPIPVLENGQMTAETTEYLPAPESKAFSTPSLLDEISACPLPLKELVTEISQELTNPIVNTAQIPAQPYPQAPLVEGTEETLIELSSTTSKSLHDLPAPPEETSSPAETLSGCPLIPKTQLSPVIDVFHQKQNLICPTDETLVSISSKSLDDVLSTPPQSPNPSTKESSQSHVIDDRSNEEFEVESLSQSLNSYNDSDIQLKGRLAESGEESAANYPTAVPENAQDVAEPEAPKEVVIEGSTTVSVYEAPASPPPAIPVETAPVTPAAVAPEPAITEDVASVTKAIEEIDISDKAVAAAVNETIESANTNEIVTHSPHQNSINE